MKKIILLLLLASCTSPDINFNKNNESLNFNNDLNYEQFKILLKKYAKISKYPNINK
tara:strand:+ start:193 stop:363 length:171 start_codon:yes stop_codon:yes gene_type:complete